MNAPFLTSPGEITECEPEPIEIDPRPCQLCGLTIDRHEMVDHGDGPEFYCINLSPDEMTLPELERRAELRRQEEVAAIAKTIFVFANHSEPPPAATPAPYRPAAATVDAFWYVVGLDDADYLAGWLSRHPTDSPHLFKIWKGKRC
jgi:hypothetical protein